MTPSPSDADILRLQSILTSLDRIAIYISGFEADSFEEDQRTVDAVAMNLLVIGEGVRRLAPALRPDGVANWPGMVSLRNRLAHAYASVAPVILWDIAALHAPELRPKIAALLETS